MCGIAGFLNYKNKEKVKILTAMSDAIAHRGPDGEGSWLDENIGLAHRRLAIIDLKTGEQPMFSADKRYVTVFNGEIYNYRELREELKNKNCEFVTNSDTEVIAESIRIWGIQQAILKFRGMFAFATYDIPEKKLYLGRDRTGIKPLYYVKIGNSLCFASEQKSLLTIPEVSRKVNDTAFYDFLTLGYPVSPATCWKDISMFPPAHFAEVDISGTIKLQKYWTWEYKPEIMNLDDALDEARSVLQNSLKYHLRSDVPLASFLSGGIDSSLLVTLLSKGGLIQNLQTFNVGFDESQYDESGDAEHVAKLAGTEHHQITMNQGTGDPAIFEKILSQYDEPFADSSCLPTYLVSKEMRKYVKVVISGDGGDELFGGYQRLIYIDRINRIRYLPLKKLMRIICGHSAWFLGDELARKLKTVLNMAIANPEKTFCLLHTYFSEKDKSALYTDEFTEHVKSLAPTWERMNEFNLCGGKFNGECLMQTELALTLHADYLRKVDIASSAHGLEVRVPFLDQEVMNFAARLPMNLKIKSGRLKYLLRELARRDISAKIADKDKWGFGVPFDRWSQGEMKDYLQDLLFSAPADEGIWRILRRSEGENLWKKFINSGEVSYLDISRYQIYQRIFMLASTQVWFKNYNPELSDSFTVKDAAGSGNVSLNMRNKKKILCVIGQLGNGGSEKQLYLFLKYLDKEKYSVKLFVTGIPGDYWEKKIMEDTGIEIVYADPSSAPAKIRSFRRCLKEFQPDVVYSWSFYVNPLCFAVGKIRFVGSLRTQYSIEKFYLNPVKRWLCKHAKSMIVNSQELANDLSQLGFRENQVKIVHNIYENVAPEGDDSPVIKESREQLKQQVFQKYSIPANAFIVMGAGGISRAKDFPFFIDTFAAAQKKIPNLHAILIGKGGLAMKDKVNEMGLNDSITITGEIPHARNIFPVADIFFLSSSQEGMPNVLLEAIDAGCAILARDVGGVRDIYSDVPKELFAKILIEERNVEVAAFMLVELVNNKPLRQAVAQLSAEIMPKFNHEKIMPKYYEALFPG